MNHWNLDQLKTALSSRREIKGWIVTEEHVQRRERYFLSEKNFLAIDQDREARVRNITARIFVKLDRPGRQGEITKKLFSSLPLQAQLDAAVAAALQTDHQAWELPAEIAPRGPMLATTDPRIAEDVERVMGELTDRIASCVAKKRPTAFNSSELFLSVHDRELYLSNGLTHRSSQSRIYAEAAYSMDTAEYLSTLWSVSLKDFDLEQLFDETSDRAEHSLDVEKPQTGKYAVIVDAEVLASLFNGQVSQLSGMNAYNRLPFLKPGDELIPGAHGDLLTIVLDPRLDYGADTAALSDQGVPQQPLPLVEKNKVLATATDKQHADYLGTAPTTVRGNVVVAPGTLSREELTRQAPRVIEILQFSGLFADPNSGTFGSEIRLAKLYDNEKGTTAFLKGGSLSGSIRENFKSARLSRNTVKRAHFSANSSQGQGYQGPEFALLNDVSIVG